MPHAFLKQVSNLSGYIAKSRHCFATILTCADTDPAQWATFSFWEWGRVKALVNATTLLRFGTKSLLQTEKSSPYRGESYAKRDACAELARH